MPPNCSILCLLLAFSFLLTTIVHGQPADLQFQHITTLNGLSQDIVTCVYRDTFGFLWIGTEDGLNRYDGYSIQHYKHNPRDSTTLSGSVITGICDFEGGNLLVSATSGLHVYDRAGDAMLRPPGALSRYASAGVRQPLRDRRGRYWMITESNGIVRYDPVTDSLTLLDPRAARASTSIPTINSMTLDDQDSVWIATDSTIAVFRSDSIGFVHFTVSDATWESDQPIRPHHVIKDAERNLWVGTDAGLYKYDRTSGTSVFVPLRSGNAGAGSGRDLIAGGFCWDQQRRLWIGGFNGLYCYDPRTGMAALYSHNPGDPTSLRSQRIYNVSVDVASIVWVGTWRGGLSRADLKKERFGHHRHTAATPLAGGSNHISAMYEDARGRLWTGSNIGGTGLTRIDFAAGEYKTYSPISGEITSIAGDRTGAIWIAAGKRMLRYDPRTDAFVPFVVPVNSREHHDIQSLYVDRRGNLWIGIYGLGVARYDIRRNAFAYYDDAGSITGAWMFYEDRAGDLWIGGWAGRNELLRYHPATDAFTHHARKELINARTMHEDGDGYFWVGTWGFGMSRLNPRTGEIRQYLEQDGLPNNYVKGILPDDPGNLWVSTEKGLSRFSMKDGTFRNYDVNDGVQGNLFYSGSCLKGSDGRLYFGGANGFNAFYPDSITDQEYDAPVVITNFRVLDAIRHLEQPLVLTKSVSLSPGEDLFSFEYVSLDYTAPERNRYAYRLEGFDKDWIHAGARRYASYTHLDPGDYTFTVKGTNSDGVWSSKTAAVHIVVLPAFWQAWWFRVSVVVVLITLLAALYRYRVNKLLELERTRSAIATDLHDDIGTSLTTIALFSDLARRDAALGSSGITDRLDKISQRSRALLDAMNDIVWSIKPENDALEQTILRMEDYAVEMLEENGIDLHVQIPETLRTMKLPMTVRRNLFLIFKEAIGNVLKHAAATHVDLRISTTETGRRNRQLQLIIGDNGKGFDPGMGRDGNGLRNMETRAQHLGGTLRVVSENRHGTRVEIQIPLKSPR